MSPIKRFWSILTLYLYWDAFRREFLIDRKMFNVMQSLNVRQEENQEAVETSRYGKCKGYCFLYCI